MLWLLSRCEISNTGGNIVLKACALVEHVSSGQNGPFKVDHLRSILGGGLLRTHRSLPTVVVGMMDSTVQQLMHLICTKLCVGVIGGCVGGDRQRRGRGPQSPH